MSTSVSDMPATETEAKQAGEFDDQYGYALIAIFVIAALFTMIVLAGSS